MLMRMCLPSRCPHILVGPLLQLHAPAGSHSDRGALLQNDLRQAGWAKGQSVEIYTYVITAMFILTY